jgi:transcriptional regulator with XRE-family HTH domain
MRNQAASSLGEIIRQQRELAEMSMRQFAEAVGISNPYLSQIERGLRAPSEQVLEGIARALETSADMLYERAGVAPPDRAEQESEVLAAIAADPRLTARQRSALREIYEAFVATSPQGRARQRTSAPAGARQRTTAQAGSSRRATPQAGPSQRTRSRSADSQRAK